MKALPRQGILSSVRVETLNQLQASTKWACIHLSAQGILSQQQEQNWGPAYPHEVNGLH